MPVKAQCPDCQSVIKAPDAARGKAVKCPTCGGRIKVPSGDGSASRSGAQSRSRQASAAGSRRGRDDDMGDDGNILAGIDLRNIEDDSNRICPRCGAKVPVDEEGIPDEICEKCGTDLETGLLTEKEKWRRKRGGPDLDKFFEKMWSEPWEYLKKNWFIGLITSIYALAAIGAVYGTLRAFAFSTGEPPQWFWGFQTVIAILMPIGWTWLLATQIINNTLAKKKKLEKIHKDIHLNAALGLKFFFWLTAFSASLPLVALILAINENFMIAGILFGVSLVWAWPHLPVVMAHMAQPIQWKAWAPWVATGQLMQTLRGSMMWLLQFFAIFLLHLIGVAVVAFMFGDDLVKHFEDVRYNSWVAAAEDAEAFKPPKSNPGDQGTDPEAEGYRKELDPKVSDPYYEYRDAEPREIDYLGDVLPTKIVLWILAIFYGFCCVYVFRTLGLFAYYHSPELAMESQKEGATWDESKVKRDEFGEVIDTRGPFKKFYRQNEGLVNTAVFFMILVLIGYGIYFWRFVE